MRLIQGLEGDHAPEKCVEVISQVAPGVRPGRFQQANQGSYAIVDDLGLTLNDEGIEVELYILPYWLKAGHDQTIASIRSPSKPSGFEIVLNQNEHLAFRVGNGREFNDILTGYQVMEKQWIKLHAKFYQKSISLTIRPITQLGQVFGTYFEQEYPLETSFEIPIHGVLALAASYAGPDVLATNFFNGRLEEPIVRTLGAYSHPIIKLDFYQKMSSDEVLDVSGYGRHGRLVNAPSRAVRGHDWDGSETDWSKATYGYGAIHFHEDDLDDACWETSFTIQIPKDARSGAYAVEVSGIKNTGVKDNITFFVRTTSTSTAKLAFVMSTFTYMAYANERMFDMTRSSRLMVPGDFTAREDEDYYRMVRRADLGVSMYDVHRDGSGTVFSSTKRPILNIRPGFFHWAFGRPREFSADLIMVGFLEQLGIKYDILYDHDLHVDGVKAAARYSTIITGSHPEYPSIQSLNAYSNFLQQGGNMIYLGGNGFYWMSVVDAQRPHRLEVRRIDQGVRTFQMPGGERHHSLNGAQGGLWRSRGRAANYLVGLGCCGEGIGPGVPYKRVANLDGKYSWVFEGLGPEELIGEHGFGGGASGDEIDRWDTEYGSPANAVILASSTGHSDEFGLFPEDAVFPITDTLGTQTDRIRSDMAIFDTGAGGQVFGIGSMNWYCSLGWDGYKNNTATVTENVIRRFVEK